MTTNRPSLNWKNLSIFNSLKKDKRGERGEIGEIGENTRYNINEILEKEKTNERNEKILHYKKGQEVKILRSDGRIMKAIIAKVYNKNGPYRVERFEDGNGYYKNVPKENLDKANIIIKIKYEIGTEVNIPRTDGRITRAVIRSFNTKTGYYGVDWIEDGQYCRKEVHENNLDKINYQNFDNFENNVYIAEVQPEEGSDYIDNEGDAIEINDNPEEDKKYNTINDSELNEFRNLNKGKYVKIYLEKLGEPKNIIKLGNGINLYTSNCLIINDRRFIVGYVKKGKQINLRLFYRSKSEGARRSCPGKLGGKYSKGQRIPNASYETTTRVLPKIEHIFNSLPKETKTYDPISGPVRDGLCGDEILIKDMENEITVNKLFKEYGNDTCHTYKGKHSSEIKEMYKKLGKNFNLKKMIFLEGEGYTYEHQYLGTIEVQLCRSNYNGQDIDFYFAKAKNDPLNRVRIEQLTYADANITSFGINDRQINASPLTCKPIEYASQVPYDMSNNERFFGSNYIDIRELYQDNPLIKRFKKESEKYNKKFNDSEDDIAIVNVVETPQRYPNGSEAYLIDQQGGKRKVKILDFNPENGEYQISDSENPLKIYFVLEYLLSPIE